MQCLGKDFNAELRKMLREMGYSEKAVEEILKWYTGNLRLDGGFEGNLRPSRINKQKQSH